MIRIETNTNHIASKNIILINDDSVDAAEAVAWGLRVRGEDRLGEHGGGPRQDPTLDPHGRQPQQAGPGQVCLVFGHFL